MCHCEGRGGCKSISTCGCRSMFGGESAAQPSCSPTPALRGYYLVGSDKQYGPGENCTAADPVDLSWWGAKIFPRSRFASRSCPSSCMPMKLDLTRLAVARLAALFVSCKQ